MCRPCENVTAIHIPCGQRLLYDSYGREVGGMRACGGARQWWRQSRRPKGCSQRWQASASLSSTKLDSARSVAPIPSTCRRREAYLSHGSNAAAGGTDRADGVLCACALREIAYCSSQNSLYFRRIRMFGWPNWNCRGFRNPPKKQDPTSRSSPAKHGVGLAPPLGLLGRLGIRHVGGRCRVVVRPV